VWARRFGDVFAAHVADLGGAEMLSEAQISLCKRAAGLAVECERIEGTLADGGEADIDLLGRLVGHLGRTLERIGLNRVPKTLDHNPLLDHFSRPPERVAAE
jgi:hypothetical protein